MERIVVITESELTECLKNAVISALKEFNENHEINGRDKLFSINQVSKMLSLSWSTVDRMVKQGQIIATPTKKITESELRKFLGKQ